MLTKFFGASALIILFSLAAAAHALDLRADCGAVGDGVADDGPALAQCLDMISDQTATMIDVPAGKYRIATPVLHNFNQQSASLIISGSGSASQILPATGSAATMLTLQNLSSLVIKDIYFVGNPAVDNDAFQTLSLQYILQATLRDTHFVGVISQTDGGAIVNSSHSDLLVERSSFRGCAGNAYYGVPVIRNDQWRGFTIRDSDFIDYGTINGQFMGRGASLTYAWVMLGNPLANTDANSQRTAVVRNVRMDEGALYGFWAGTDPTAAANISNLAIFDLTVNVMGSGAGLNISNTDNVRIEDSLFGYVKQPAVAIRLKNTGNIIIKHSRGTLGAQTVLSEGQTAGVVVEDSDFQTLSIPTKALTVIRNGRTAAPVTKGKLGSL